MQAWLTEKDHSYKVLFEKEQASVTKGGKTVLNSNRRNGLYYLEFDKPEETANFTPSDESEIMKWHKKLGHVNERDPKEMEPKSLYSSSSQDPVDEPSPSSGRSQRDVRPPAWTKDYELIRCVTMVTSENNDDNDCSLLTYKEAVTGTNR
ncbi:unnamed protein product [Pieris brassicae]|uniref:GAG-pre-integrase domain-containing protein n=1 Tax=Pieris brassicae TaxID=7116 RepID=A0A9P0TST9_PIEBR|nr:unnamed protein product [Pieris brassicae]